MNILTNGEFIKSINKVISGFGATPSNITLTNDQLDDVVDNQIFDRKMEELAAAVPSGGGGSGSGGLVVKMVDNGDKLDKTAREIINAMPFVWVEINMPSSPGAKVHAYTLMGSGGLTIQTHYIELEGDFSVYMFEVDDGNDDFTFIANGLDEYPALAK